MIKKVIFVAIATEDNVPVVSSFSLEGVEYALSDYMGALPDSKQSWKSRLAKVIKKDIFDNEEWMAEFRYDSYFTSPKYTTEMVFRVYQVPID